jgi:hypothetical protein
MAKSKMPDYSPRLAMLSHILPDAHGLEVHMQGAMKQQLMHGAEFLVTWLA